MNTFDSRSPGDYAPRILLVSGSLIPIKCGIGDYTGHLAAALEALSPGTVAVLTNWEARGHQPLAGYAVFPTIKQWSPSAGPAILQAVRRWKPDVVHMQFPTRGYDRRLFPWLVPFLLAGMGIPVVQTWHEYYPAGSGWRNIFNAIAPGGLIVVRPHYLERMPPWYRRLIARKHFRMIPNAAALPTAQLSEADRIRIRQQFGACEKKLVVYFGFVYPAKGVDALASIGDPQEDQLVIVGELNASDPYQSHVLAQLQAPPWSGRTFVTGFLPEAEAAAVLAAADAVVLPFKDGGGFWNTSVHAAAKQGVFVLTTSSDRRGYDVSTNIYHAEPGNIDEMRQALRRYAGTRRPANPDSRTAEWEEIALAHRNVYASVVRRRERR